MKMTEELVKSVKEYKNGNSEAFNSVYEQSYAYLHTCVIHIVKDEDVAQDMIQDTYMEIIKNIVSLEKEESFLSWAAMIANRKCFARIKKNQELLVSDSEEEQSDYFENIADDEAFIPENILDNQAKVEIIKGIIDELSDVQRACVIGFYYNEQKQDEIAEELGIPVNTVKSHLNRAKAKIKESVGETEKKQGIKLYSIAPFMLLFFTKEVKACELVPMSEALAEAGSASVNVGSVSKVTSGTKKVAGATKKIAGWKIGAIAGVVAVAGIAGVVATTNKDKASTEIAESVEQVEKAVEEKEIVDDTPVDAVEEIEPEGELSDLEKVGLSYDVVYEGPYEIIDSHNGVSIVYDENMEQYGLISNDGNVLVPVEYDGTSWMVDKEGYTFFIKNDKYYVFDIEGNQVYSTENKIIGISDGYVTEVAEEQGFIKSINGENIYNCYFDYYGYNGGMVPFSEGYAFAQNYGQNYTEDNIDRISVGGEVSHLFEAVSNSTTDSNNGNKSTEGSGEGGTMFSIYPMGMTSEGYVLFRGMQGLDDIRDIFALYDTNGEWIGSIKVLDFLENNGFSGDYKYSVTSSHKNNGYIYNYGSKLVIKGSSGVHERYYLVDIAGVDIDETPFIMFDAEKIYYGDELLWLYKSDNGYGYINHEGKVIGEYEDASKFDNGIAMIIQDGKAYFVDEELNLLGDGIEADSISNCGDLFAVTQGESVIYIGRNGASVGVNERTIEEGISVDNPKDNIFDNNERNDYDIIIVEDVVDRSYTHDRVNNDGIDWENAKLYPAGTRFASHEVEVFRRSYHVEYGDGYSVFSSRADFSFELGADMLGEGFDEADYHFPADKLNSISYYVVVTYEEGEYNVHIKPQS